MAMHAHQMFGPGVVCFFIEMVLALVLIEFDLRLILYTQTAVCFSPWCSSFSGVKTEFKVGCGPTEPEPDSGEVVVLVRAQVRSSSFVRAT